jgi:hypothetical protein
MYEDTDRQTGQPARVIEVIAFGDTADEIELVALDQARAFFGGDRQLEVIRDYKANGIIASIKAEAESGKKYRAEVRVRAIGS